MQTRDYQRIERALRILLRDHRDPPALDALAAELGLSRFHFQRLFTRLAGISPGRFVHHLVLQEAKDLLARRSSVLDAALDAGLSGPGRLHDLFVAHEAVTPGEFKARGAGLRIAYGFHPTPFGTCLVGVTERGVCALSFVDDDGAAPQAARGRALDGLRARWPRAVLEEAPARTEPVAAAAFAPPGAADRGRTPLRVLLHGTNFQVQVWAALLRIPPGATATYGDVAAAVGRPGAARAVGRALADNPVACLIPCHRVIRGLGVLGGYRWGEDRKRMLLAWEAAGADGDTAEDADADGGTETGRVPVRRSRLPSGSAAAAGRG